MGELTCFEHLGWWCNTKGCDTRFYVDDHRTGFAAGSTDPASGSGPPTRPEDWTLLLIDLSPVTPYMVHPYRPDVSFEPDTSGPEPTSRHPHQPERVDYRRPLELLPRMRTTAPPADC